MGAYKSVWEINGHIPNWDHVQKFFSCGKFIVSRNCSYFIIALCQGSPTMCVHVSRCKNVPILNLSILFGVV